MARNKTSIEEKYNAPFPTALRTLMEERGETQESIAKAAGKTRQTISQYVNGISEPGYDVLVKIADYFDVSTDYLLGRTADPSRTPCLADELGLSIKAISAIRDFGRVNRFVNSDYRREGLIGLNLLLEAGGLLAVCLQFKRFCEHVQDEISVAEMFKKSVSRTEEYDDSEFYKFVLMAEEDRSKGKAEVLVNRNFPELKDRFQLILGSKALEYEKISILNSFEDILSEASKYDEFKKHVIKW